MPKIEQESIDQVIEPGTEKADGAARASISSVPVLGGALSNIRVSHRTFLLRLMSGMLVLNLFVAGFAGFSLLQSRQLHAELTANSTENLARSLEQTIANVFDKADVALLAIANEAERQLATGRIDKARLDAYISRQKAHIPELANVRVADAEGAVAYGTGLPAGEPVYVADRDYFTSVRDTPQDALFIARPVFGRFTHTWVMNLSRRVKHPNGTFAGIVFATIPIDYFTTLFSSFDLGAHGVITLCDRDMAIIARHPEPKGAGSSIGMRVQSKELRHLMQMGRTAATYRAPSTIDNVERTFSFRTIPRYHLVVFVGRASRDSYAAWMGEVWNAAGIAALFFLVTLAASWQIYRNWAREKEAQKELARHREHLAELVKERTSELEVKNEQLEEAQRIAHVGSWEVDHHTGRLHWSGEIYRIFGIAPSSREPRYQDFLDVVHPDDRHAVDTAYTESLRDRKSVYNITFRVLRPGGETRYMHAEGETSFDEAGNPLRTVGTAQDITAHRLLEDQLRQAQKMESVGRLAGGVAHDFNNLLCVILGNVDLAMFEVNGTHPLHKHLADIRSAAERSADLTRQLLTFARQQAVAPKVLDLNGKVEVTLTLLRRLIGEDIDLAWLPGKGLWPIRLDPSQLDQLLTNLCVNARDAIPDVGKITIETSNSVFDEAYCTAHRGFVPGEFVLLAISDNGCGMDKNTMDRIFEPFFTTKELGKGTGLGLATVYGIVKQNNGFINVYSEPGNGTTFKIYLPRFESQHTMVDTAMAAAPPRGRGEALLLVEDEPTLLESTGKMLEMQGYHVLSANTPEEAIRLAKEYTGTISLLMTDVVMPGMNGRELSDKILLIRPEMKTLFMSGYTANVIAHHGVLDEGVHFIQKPFSLKDLAAKVGSVLEQA